MVYVILKNDLTEKGLILKFENEQLFILENIDFSEIDFNTFDNSESDKLIKNIIDNNEFDIITLFDLYNYSIFNYSVLDNISDYKKLKNGNFKKTFERLRYSNNMLGFIQCRIKNYTESEYYSKYGYYQKITVIRNHLELFKPNVKYVRFEIKRYEQCSLYIKDF